jgi:hypothetical protein
MSPRRQAHGTIAPRVRWFFNQHRRASVTEQKNTIDTSPEQIAKVAEAEDKADIVDQQAAASAATAKKTQDDEDQAVTETDSQV